MAALVGGGMVEDRLAFIAFTTLLVGYVTVQILAVRRSHPERWMLNPAVLATVSTFVLGYGITNAIYLLPPEQQLSIGHEPDITSSMVKLSGLALAASVAMWVGYWSPLGATVGTSATSLRVRAAVLSGETTVRPGVVVCLFAVSIFARLAQIRLGVFGYAGTLDQLHEMAHITQYLYMFGQLGKLALALAVLQASWGTGGTRNRIVMCVILVAEVFFGTLSGFKSAVAFPFLVVAVCQYLSIGRVKPLWIASAIVCLAGAYSVIEPFRAARDRDGTFDGTTVSSIARTIRESVQESRSDADTRPALLLAVASRMNLTNHGAYGIDYSDNNLISDQDPKFLGNLLLAPAHAVVPRLLWASKPLSTDGIWYNQVVLGRSHISSAAMGPVTYLYCAAGVLGVTLGFFVLGLSHRALWFWLQPWCSLAGALVFLGLLTTIAMPSSSWDSTVVNLCRELPLLLLLQLVLLPRASRAMVPVEAHPRQAQPVAPTASSIG
jgi:hypothetical protein